MAASQTFDSKNGSTLSYGIMGAVTSIPAGYTVETLLSVSAAGGAESAVFEPFPYKNDQFTKTDSGHT